MEDQKIPAQKVPENTTASRPKRWRRLALLALPIIVVAIPLTIFLAQQEQDVRQRAAPPNSGGSQARVQDKVCSAGNLDIMLLIDRSNSMEETTSGRDKTPRIAYAKKAAHKFVTILGQEKTNSIGIAQFANNGGIALNFTSNVPRLQKTIVDLKTDAPWGTCVHCAVLATNEAIGKRTANNKNKKFALILSDGRANRVRTKDNGISNENDIKKGQEQAFNAIMAGHKRDGTIFYTIGLGGNRENEGNKWMKKIADRTGGKYYFAPDASTLEKIYEEIATSLGKASVSGVVFEDKNKNGVFNTGVDAALPETKVSLQSASSKKVLATVRSAAGGKYTFTELCAEKYHVVQEKKPGYTQTVPKNPDYYVIDATKTSIDFINKNFGNIKGNVPTNGPTVTPASGSGEIEFTFNFALHGIGIAGDNVVLRPAPCQRGTTANKSSGVCLNNQEPVHPQRQITVELVSDGKAVGTMNGTMEYNEESGTFEGVGVMRSQVKPGAYTFRAYTPMFLKKKFIFAEEIKPGGKYKLPIIDLTSSDVDNDNKLTILDYNMIANCYTLPEEEPRCAEDVAALVDVDDNGENNEFDVNLFTRDVSVLKGD